MKKKIEQRQEVYKRQGVGSTNTSQCKECKAAQIIDCRKQELKRTLDIKGFKSVREE